MKELLKKYQQDSIVQTLAEKLKTPRKRLKLNGLAGSLDAIVLSATYFLHNQNYLIIAQDREEAAYFVNDLESIFPEKEIHLFPGSYKKPYEFQEIENANVLARTEILHRISRKDINGELIVSYPEALTEKVINKRSLVRYSLRVSTGVELNMDSFNENLIGYGFEKTDFVFEAGQYSLRGGIVDVFSFTNELPYRIELTGNSVESIRTFNPDTQISVKYLNEIQLLPNIQANLLEEKRESFLSFFPDNTVIWIKDYSLVSETIEKYFGKASQEYQEFLKKGGDTSVLLEPAELFETTSTFNYYFLERTIVEFGSRQHLDNSEIIEFSAGTQPSFNKNFELLADKLGEYSLKGYTCFIASESENQFTRLRSIFNEINPGIHFEILFSSIRAGFIDHLMKILIFTDHQIFDRYHRYKSKPSFSKSKALTLRELKTLQPGDYVTHIDYGIGRFVGLDKIDVDGRAQEALRIIYKDDDLLYIGVQSLHKISKYSGREGSPAVLSKLGSGDWEQKKRKVKKRVKDIAQDLIRLYAKRKATPGFNFSSDSYLQAELESSFIYEDTPDQARAAIDVKKDLEKPFAMDRLVCGDVGFGKTEVAIRAAFKSVSDSKQVAILVPTTILAFQHYRTFRERLIGFPVNIDYLSRFRPPSEVKRIIREIMNGQIDIIIGTHRLVAKDVKFHDLGLLVIDEEQKFGVSMKEKIKEFKINVDTLTLTATPIPRTLQFSLMGARDLSIIATPPPNRQPVTTEVHSFNEALIRDAIRFELKRNGQVFFVHNRISDIEEIANNILKLVPDAKIAIAHGQMKGDKLEKIMLKFIDGYYNVLVSTNIIESGLDIPNANTIIINRAHTFGLSDLHQMRGRVGRSNQKAYCYLLTPPKGQLTSESIKRLITLEEFSELGDGFKVAMRDLDIRGAGNLLGAEQSGFINDLGFDTYHNILDEAIQELKENEFRDLFEVDLAKKAALISQDCIIETDLEMLIPDDYVKNISERLNLYGRLDNIMNEEQLSEFEAELRDRFGPIPEPVFTLMDTVRLRWIAVRIGFEKIMLKNNTAKAYFINTGKDDYYKSEVFGSIIKYVQQHPKNCRFREVNNKPTLTLNSISSVSQAMAAFQELCPK
ncbi:MAG TPA: transcription-repair coupling factor [Cyclobacteriaceae bacterium]|nr:transcription-repair coupling factor [Cyclobacteriaceae bacterium]